MLPFHAFYSFSSQILYNNSWASHMYVRVWLCEFAWECMCVYECVFVWTYVCKCVWVNVYMSVCVCIECKREFVQMSMWMWECACVCVVTVYVHECVSTWVFVWVCVCVSEREIGVESLVSHVNRSVRESEFSFFCSGRCCVVLAKWLIPSVSQGPYQKTRGVHSRTPCNVVFSSDTLN